MVILAAYAAYNIEYISIDTIADSRTASGHISNGSASTVQISKLILIVTAYSTTYRHVSYAYFKVVRRRFAHLKSQLSYINEARSSQDNVVITL